MDIEHEFNTHRVRYVGPNCANGVSYTVDVRFICGRHLVSVTLTMSLI